MRSATRRAAGALFDNPILVGTMTILVVLVAVYLSYIAENGLPFVPTYRHQRRRRERRPADQERRRADRRRPRRAGADDHARSRPPRPGRIRSPASGCRWNAACSRWPTDTHYQVRLASVLGGNYLEILPGHSRHGGLADGGTFTLNTNARRNHDLGFVDLDQALATFGPRTRSGLRGVAGRARRRGRRARVADQRQPRLAARADGAAAEPARRCWRHPTTRLPDFVERAGGDHRRAGPGGAHLRLAAARRRHDLRRRSTAPSLGQTHRPAPADRVAGHRGADALAAGAGRGRPDRAGAQARRRAAAAGRRPRWTGSSPPPRPSSASVPTLASALQRRGRGGRCAGPRPRLVAGPSRCWAPATWARSAPRPSSGLGAILRTVSTAQFACNVAGLWVRNFASSLSEGDSDGRLAALLADARRPARPSSRRPRPPDLHLNYYPIEDSSQCQAGNEVYTPGQLIGNPPRTSTRVDNTARRRECWPAGRRRVWCHERAPRPPRACTRWRSRAADDPGGASPSPSTPSTRGCRSSHKFTVSAVVAQQRQRPLRGPGADRRDRRRRRSPACAPAGDASKVTLHARLERPARAPRRHRADPRPAVPGGQLLPRPRSRHPERARRCATAARSPSPRPSSPVQFYQVLSTFDVAARADLTHAGRHAGHGLCRRPRAVCWTRRRRRPQARLPAAGAGREGRRPGQPRAARHPARRPRAAAHLGLGR